MPATGSVVSSHMVGVIDQRLDEIESEHEVRILFAIESGSRAWGFPPPDSDYDVRFIYVHAPDWYLSIDARRDVIELPIEGDLDINGWDLKKALQLLIKPNPVLLEWLRSPVVYRNRAAAMERFADLAKRTAHFRPSLYHYLHSGSTQHRKYISGKDRVVLKKYFYALRPALALIWLRTKPDVPVPTALNELRAGLKLDSEVSEIIDDLVARKTKTIELGKGPRIPALDALIETEFESARNTVGQADATAPDLLNEANVLFRDLVLNR